MKICEKIEIKRDLKNFFLSLESAFLWAFWTTMSQVRIKKCPNSESGSVKTLTHICPNPESYGAMVQCISMIRFFDTLYDN